MNFKRKGKLTGVGVTSTNKYHQYLQMYSRAPGGQIPLQDFDKFALIRLKVLRAVDSIGLKFTKWSDEYKDAVRAAFREARAEEIGIFSRDNPGDKALATADNVSHYILRLAYCKSENLRRWLIQQETDLFKFRLSLLKNDDLPSFLEVHKLNYYPISTDERNAILDKLSTVYTGKSTIDMTNFYKVPFEEVCDLIKNRRVYVQRGFAFVPQSDLSVIICNLFRRRLSEELTRASHRLHNREEDTRLSPKLSHLSNMYIGQDYNKSTANATQFTADMIESLSRESFPMCMQQMERSLHENHHLRHNGRLQFGLFLKGIGLPLDEAIRYWKSEFFRGNVDADKFDKQYLYNIRYNYGKEGRKANYTPYSCVKIITTNQPSTGDNHGCPFKHCDKGLLQQKLQAQKLPKDGIEEIMKLVESSNYQLACAKQFELRHNAPKGSFNVNHPNQYFEQSRLELTEASGDKTSGGVVLVPVKADTSQSSDSSQPPESNPQTQVSNVEEDGFETLSQEQESALFRDMDVAT